MPRMRLATGCTSLLRERCDVRDGNLRSKFMKNLPDAFWQSVETWSTGQGVPDSHFIFPGGIAGWIEHKKTEAWAVVVDKEQVAWLERYSRQGGRCFVAVRRHAPSGPRRGASCDELHLFRGSDARGLMIRGLRGGPAPILSCWGGSVRWDWPAVRKVLIAKE